MHLEGTAENTLTNSLWPGLAPPEKLVIGVLPGEGIGPEVIRQAVDVTEAATANRHSLELRWGGPIGRESEQKCGQALSPEVRKFCEEIFSVGGAVLCGPGGGRFVYDLRQQFGLYCKLTPVRPIPALNDCGAVCAEARENVDLVVVRENSGGIYFGNSSVDGLKVSHEFRYSVQEVRRILAVAIGLAKQRRKHLTLVVKPAGVPGMSKLWCDELESLTRDEDLTTNTLEVDNAAYQVIANAQAFDVVVAPNLFGDVVSDVAALLLGSRGLSYSANLGERRIGVYQTGHGAAFDLAGTNTANPIGQILSAAMMLREHFGLHAAAADIEAAVAETVASGLRTPDISASNAHVASSCDTTSKPPNVLGTRELGNAIATAVSKIAAGRRDAKQKSN